MPEIEYEGGRYSVADGESVLDVLLRNGIKAAHSCKAGACGSCIMRATEGEIPAKAQAGLKESWKSQGYFLACLCRPMENLAIAGVGDDARSTAIIAALDLLSSDVMRVRLRCEQAIHFRAGQYITVLRDEGLARSYSIASLPEEREIELHVRRISGGRMSGWFHTEARIGTSVSILGPSGECFYVPGRDEQPLLLVGAGTGLAPLYGILRDALRHKHRGHIHLFHGAVHPGGLYLVDEIRRLAERHLHVEYTPVVLNGSEAEGYAVGSIDQVVSKRFPNLSGWRGFVCGDPGLVGLLKKKLFLSGMASREIHADAFVPAAAAR